MIIDFSHDVDTYHELLAHYGKWSYTCPVCNSVGEWQCHGSYLRYLIVNEGNLYNIDYNASNRIHSKRNHILRQNRMCMLT